jgi:hypothetical protein
MKIAIVALTFALAVTVVNADTFTGVITDTMCGAKPHSLMSKDRTDAECIKMCTKGPHEYALLDGGNVIKLSDQNAAAKYPAQKVKVTGTYEEKSKTIKVTSIEPLDGK